ncbi:hypothetical protein KEJ21_06045 [Candidatus Bathyarchaeota archaeon]|nr:hypothetical protein [Candidatus Bathyarchaeota archaeon]MBS7630922.1 hypothetical protein [Candidatus Bathyarchaeota archaeon]
MIKIKGIRCLRELTKILHVDRRMRRLCLIKPSVRDYPRSVFRSTMVNVFSYTKNGELSQRFIDFLTSDEVRKIYSSYGWILKR